MIVIVTEKVTFNQVWLIHSEQQQQLTTFMYMYTRKILPYALTTYKFHDVKEWMKAANWVELNSQEAQACHLSHVYGLPVSSQKLTYRIQLNTEHKQ